MVWPSNGIKPEVVRLPCWIVKIWLTSHQEGLGLGCWNTSILPSITSSTSILPQPYPFPSSFFSSFLVFVLRLRPPPLFSPLPHPYTRERERERERQGEGGRGSKRPFPLCSLAGRANVFLTDTHSCSDGLVNSRFRDVKLLLFIQKNKHDIGKFFSLSSDKALKNSISIFKNVVFGAS